MLYKVVCQYRETFKIVSEVCWNLVENLETFLALGKEAEDLKCFMMEGGIDRDPEMSKLETVNELNLQTKLSVNS